MRIVVFGQQAFGKDVFEALVEAGEEVVGVSTPREPEGRPDPLAQAARERGLPVIVTRDLRRDAAFEQYRALEPELLVFAFVTDIVRQNVLDAAKHGAIQYHPSLLPLHRGRSAMNWAIMAGEPVTGLTIFWVDPGIDTGPIILQRSVEVGANDSVGSLYFEKLYRLGVEAMVEAVGLVREGRAPRVEQDHSRATYEPPTGPEHARVDWYLPGQVVHNLIRGCDPQPGARALLNGQEVRLFGSTLRPASPEEAPGTVIEVGESGADVAVIGGVLTIARMQPPEGRKVAAAEVVRAGDVLRRVPGEGPEAGS